jgi:DNA polymerase/3'-5' exonuclease PolX
MSEHPKQPYAGMKRCADALVEKLRPTCARIEIAGSLRRQKPFCSDIELVAVPIPVLDLIGEPLGTETEVDRLLDTLPVTFTKRGRKYQQFWFDGTSAPFYVDLFLQPDPATWGVNFLVRTGSAEFSHRMVTPASYGGYKPDGFEIREARVWRNGQLIATPEEGDVFELWSMDFIRPEERL